MVVSRQQKWKSESGSGGRHPCLTVSVLTQDAISLLQVKRPHQVFIAASDAKFSRPASV